MKVKISKERLMLVPETDFEEEYLKNYFPLNSGDNNCFYIRHSGSSLSDLIGIILKKGERR